MTGRQKIFRALRALSPEALSYFFPGYSIEEAEAISDSAEIADWDGMVIGAEMAGEDGISFMELCEPEPPFALQYGSVPQGNKKMRSRSRALRMAYHKMEDVPQDAAMEVTQDAAMEMPQDAAMEVTQDVADQLLRELEDIQRKYNVTIEQIEAVLSYKVRLSHLRITTTHEIILDEFDYREVKMDTLTKAVYLLFLKHPEGIRFKELSDYAPELETIYMSITGRTDMDSIKRSIQSLTDPLDNSINEKVSKAKKAFKNVIDERIAKFYFIEGKQGAAKTIPLDRALVIWE